MGNESLAAVLILAALAAAALLAMLRERQSMKKRWLRQIRERFGSLPEEQPSAEKLAALARIAKQHASGRFWIDEVTWRDLGMDEIFCSMNHTVSACGEEVLYAMLRLPEFETGTLKDRERLAEFLREKRDLREELQSRLAGIGKNREHTASEYLDSLFAAEQKGILRYVIQAALAAFSVVLFFLQPVAAVFLFVGMVIVNITTHAREGRTMEPYLSGLSCLLRMLKAAEGLTEQPSAELENWQKQVRALAAPLRQLRSGTVTLVRETGVDLGAGALLSYLNAFFLMDYISFYRVIRNVQQHADAVTGLYEALGFLDSCIAIASFREWLPYFCEPEFVSEPETRLTVGELYHPALSHPVPSSFSCRGGVLITGSNASGKSTFLKTVALNAILAQSIGTCTARSWQGTMVKTMSAMALRDDLSRGESYYMAEIRALKRILEEIRIGAPVLCVVDEVLRGTNTIERIAASSRLLASLRQASVLCFAATHDIELTRILESCYENVHFDENITAEGLSFPYQLRAGRATSRNALLLLEQIGFDPSMVEQAKEAAEAFERNGTWVPLTEEP